MTLALGLSPLGLPEALGRRHFGHSSPSMAAPLATLAWESISGETVVVDGSKAIPAPWDDLTVYAAGDFRTPGVANGCWFECTEGGTSGAMEPTWNTDQGDLTADGGAGGLTWKCWHIGSSMSAPFNKISEAVDYVAGLAQKYGNIIYVRAVDDLGLPVVYNTQHGSSGAIVNLPGDASQSATQFNVLEGYSVTPGDMLGHVTLDCADTLGYCFRLASSSTNTYWHIWNFLMKRCAASGASTASAASVIDYYNCRSESYAAPVIVTKGLVSGFIGDDIKAPASGGYVLDAGNVSDCQITNITHIGGGIRATGTVSRCLVTFSASYTSMGAYQTGIQAPTVSACTLIWQRVGVGESTGILDATMITDTIIVGFTYAIGTHMDTRVANCDLYSNGTPYNTYSDAGRITEDGILVVDPLFINANSGDYRLHRYSPCATSGSSGGSMGASGVLFEVGNYMKRNPFGGVQ